MKKILKRTLILALVVVATAFATYRIIMCNLSIETDGDGDSAFVTVFGQTDFYGINGYTVG